MKSSRRAYAIIALCCCLLALACNGAIYTADHSFFQDAISPRHRWSAGGNVLTPLRAIDGDINTAAVATPGQDNAMLDIDLGKACLINMVVVDHGLNQFGYCQQMAVLTSDDGRNWRQQIVVPGLRRVTNALLVSPVLTRYIRLYAVTTGAKGWSLAEVYLN